MYRIVSSGWRLGVAYIREVSVAATTVVVMMAAAAVLGIASEKALVKNDCPARERGRDRLRAACPGV